MGKKKFILTESDLRGAKHYIPLHKMATIAKVIAPKCLEKSKTAEQNQKGLEFLALPTLWVDDVETKELYKMSVLLTEYLQIKLPEDFSDEQYDIYGSAHILNQLERFKSNLSLKDTVFDILENYKKFEKMLNIEIENEKAVRNDPVARLTAAISIVSNPDNIRRMQEELEQATIDFESAKREARARIEGKADES